jgi:hypothetical protein
MAIQLLGPGNTPWSYAVVLLVYAALFVIMLHAQDAVPLNQRRAYWVLYAVWAPAVFAGNYAFYRLGIMSFLPWANNFFHTFIWIGFCLSFLYVASRSRPAWHQFLMFAAYSAIVKFAEHGILGTWEQAHFFGIQGNVAYIIGWSLLDGLYPFISMVVLSLAARVMEGVPSPRTTYA